MSMFNNLSNSTSWSEKEELFPGIWVYRNVINKEMNFVHRMKSVIDNNPDPRFQWKDACVGYMQKMPEYRDCQDFKLNINHTPSLPVEHSLNEIWKDVYESQKKAVDDYCAKYNIQMQFWEAMNFIKYGPGQHFQEHADHGYSYYCTVSLVAYPNDDYEGGGLYFPKLGLHIQPKAGDLYIFPSTFLFSHIALPVTSGTKYSLVTMLDYNDNAHNHEFYEMGARRTAMSQGPTIQSGM